MKKKGFLGNEGDAFIAEKFKVGLIAIGTRDDLLNRIGKKRNPLAESGPFDGFIWCATREIALSLMGFMGQKYLIVYAGDETGYVIGFCSEPEEGDDD